MTGRNIILAISGISTFFLSIIFVVRFLIGSTVTSEIPEAKDRPALFSNTSADKQSTSLTDFADETFIRGVTHRHAQKKTTLSSFEDTLGSGVCIFDFNNDGWDDLFFITGSGNRRHFGRENWWSNPQTNRLYLNKNGIFFEDVTETSGIKDIDFGLACAAADLDDDGLTDLVVANKGGNSIYKNLGDGKFSKQTNAFANDPKFFSTSILIKDFNGDGLKDILFGNYVTINQDQNILELNAGYQTQQNVNFDRALYDAQPDTLYLNNGNSSFTESTSYTSANMHGRTLGFYEDGAIVALNDKGSTSQVVYLPEQNKTLSKVVLNARDAAQIQSPDDTAGGELPKRLLIASDATKGGVYALALGEHESNDKSWDYGINTEESLYSNSWAVLIADFNRDGNDDIFVTNGLLTPHPDTEMTTVGQPNRLLIVNKTQHRFDNYVLPNERVLSSRGAAYFDFNNDGALDIAINNNNDFASLLVNKTPYNANWVGLKCTPTFLCENTNINIGKKIFSDAFKPKRHFMSQSGSGLILQLGTETKANITIKTKNIKFNASLNQINRYYLIDLNKKSITPLQTNSEIATSDNLTSREELISLIRGDINNGRTKLLTAELMETKKSDKMTLTSAINESANHDFFPLADAWAQSTDPDIALPAIETLRKMEAEEAVPTLINLLASKDPLISCAASHAFEYFYWKDEAVIERKNWAVTPLVQLLESPDAKIRICAIDALSESESFRALHPLLAHLTSGDSWETSSVVKALGMLRQTTAISRIKELLLEHPSPIVRAQALVALIRLDAQLDEATESKILTKNNLFNATFILALRQLDDGVTATRLSRKLADQKVANEYQFLKYFSVDQLYSFYQNHISNDKQDALVSKLQSSYHDKLTLNEFTLLTTMISESTQISKIFLSLDFADRAEIFEKLSYSVIKEIIADDALAVLNLCKTIPSGAQKESLCLYISKLEKAAPKDVTDILRLMINSGLYETTYLAGQALKSSQTFTLARNELFYDNKILDTDKLKILINFPLDPGVLSSVTEFFLRLDAQDQIDALNALERSLPTSTLVPWLKKLPTQKLPKSTQFHIEGNLARNNQEKK